MQLSPIVPLIQDSVNKYNSVVACVPHLFPAFVDTVRFSNNDFDFISEFSNFSKSLHEELCHSGCNECDVSFSNWYVVCEINCEL